MSSTQRPLAVVTGASTGIGYELAKICAQEGFDLVVAADEPRIEDAANDLRALGAYVDAVQVDLSTFDGVDELYAAIGGRPVDALLANAGTALGHAFLDEDVQRIRRVVDTNINGTIYLVHRVGNDMRTRDQGRILLTGSIAGFIPGSFMAVYNGTKAFVNSFAFALRDELKETNITVTVLYPGATETEIFEHADMQKTPVAQAPKDDPAMVAKVGFDAMMAGTGDVAAGLKNKVLTALANVTPAALLAKVHRKMAKPDGGRQRR